MARLRRFFPSRKSSISPIQTNFQRDLALPQKIVYTVATLQGYIPAITFQKRRRADNKVERGAKTEIPLSAADREGWRFVFELSRMHLNNCRRDRNEMPLSRMAAGQTAPRAGWPGRPRKTKGTNSSASAEGYIRRV